MGIIFLLKLLDYQSINKFQTTYLVFVINISKVETLKNNYTLSYSMLWISVLNNLGLSKLICKKQQRAFLNVPQRAAQRISELKRFLYLRISGVSEARSWDVGVTLTLTWLSLREPPPALNPKVRNERCFCRE